MARNKRRIGYNNESQIDNLNRVTNLVQGMADKIGVQSPFDKEFVVEVPSEGFKQLAANTTNPTRPRAKAIAYNFENRSLYVVFRDGTWWEYRNCPVSYFEGLKNTDSTGKYLRESGLDTWSDMGPADIDEMSSERKERLSYAAEASGRLQQTLILEEDNTQLRGQ